MTIVVDFPIGFGRYQLVERLALGGMAELFIATSPGEHGFQKKVVIKRLLPALVHDETYNAMFIDEAKLTARLVHPKIAQTFELGKVDEQLFIAMEYIDGIDVLALLREFAAANSRFAPILKDDAAATVHIAFNLSDDWKKAVETVRTSFNSHLNDAPEAAIAEMREIIHSLTSSSEHGTVEAMVKLGWSKESGGVIYGGIHADENDKLLDSVFAMANIDGSGFDRIEKGEMQLLVAELPDDYQSELVRLTHVYVAHVNSCLWFAIGGENAHEIIRLSVDRCSKSDGPIQTPLLTTALDFEKLISYPQDDPTGLTAVAPVCFASIDGLIKNYTFTRSVDSEESESESDSNADLAFRALQLGGSKQLSLTVDADESGLVVRGTLGNALVRAVMAPTIGMFDRLVQTSQTSSEGEVEVSPTEPETR